MKRLNLARLNGFANRVLLVIIRCVWFFNDNASLQIIRMIQDERTVMTKKGLKRHKKKRTLWLPVGVFLPRNPLSYHI